MSQLEIESVRLRPKSSINRNYQNIQLHACLDEARLYQDRVGSHFSQSKFENHCLQSAERFYARGSKSTARSSSAFRRSSSQLNHESNGIDKNARNHRNPEQLLGAFAERTLKISQIKAGFDDGTAQVYQLKQRIEELKRNIVIQKNRKAKISLNNSKLMNANQISNHQTSRLLQQSRRNRILISQIENDISQLQNTNNNLMKQNQRKDQEINQLNQQNSRLDDYINRTRRKLIAQRANLEQLKEAQTISYKQMTNSYMIMNQRKQEIALLLNSIEIDVANNSA